MIESFDQAAAIVPDGDLTSGGIEHLGEVGSAEIRHAEDAQAARRIVTDRVHRDDMRMLEPRQDLGLVAIGPRYLDGHQPPAEADLLGKINAGKSASTQLENDAKARQLVTRMR